MKLNHLITPLFFLTVACGGNDSEGEVCEGTAGCACFEGGTCVEGLTCVAAGGSNVCVDEGGDGADGGDDGATTDGGASTTGTGTGTTGTTGVEPETALCERADECNILMPGVSATDCADLERMCTDNLITSQYEDWNREVDNCLELSNCQNFLGCVYDLSTCPPISPDAQCGPECEFCWYGTATENMCPADYEGDMLCDCGCQFTDAIDCA